MREMELYNWWFYDFFSSANILCFTSNLMRRNRFGDLDVTLILKNWIVVAEARLNWPVACHVMDQLNLTGFCKDNNKICVP